MLTSTIFCYLQWRKPIYYEVCLTSLDDDSSQQPQIVNNETCYIPVTMFVDISAGELRHSESEKSEEDATRRAVVGDKEYSPNINRRPPLWREFVAGKPLFSCQCHHQVDSIVLVCTTLRNCYTIHFTCQLVQTLVTAHLALNDI